MFRLYMDKFDDENFFQAICDIIIQDFIFEKYSCMLTQIWIFPLAFIKILLNYGQFEERTFKISSIEL